MEFNRWVAAVKSSDPKIDVLEGSWVAAGAPSPSVFYGEKMPYNFARFVSPTNIKLLDEIDSGLDIDALRVVSCGVNAMRGDNFGALMITHYQRLLDYIVPDVVHVMMDGRVVKDGGPDLAKKLEKEGYAGLRDELGLDIKLVDEN